MLKEIVEFSKQLEDAGIYALVNEGERKLDKPVMVIPAFLDDEEDKILEDAVAEDFMKGDSEKDAAYDKS
ncbi:MAG: hypothetical protein HKUEN01_29390 [Candidatus Kuenenia stuttgartiensis]|nr:MAG: hypothetical protein HKUEN01_29390 [Candidatus Kuenenia stuttgartiensis]